jgi:hypothetical protein
MTQQPCICCGRLSLPDYPTCVLCAPIVQIVRDAQQLHPYEHAAVQFAAETVTPLIEKFGSDLFSWEAEQVTEFIGSIIKAFGVGLREQIASKEIPF